MLAIPQPLSFGPSYILAIQNVSKDVNIQKCS